MVATTVGIWGAIGGLAIAGGPLVGGAVVQGLDWHWIFWLNVPVGLAAAGLSLSRLPESRGPAARLDLPGVAMAAIGAVALAWGLVRTSDVGWGSPEVIGALVLAAVLIAGFVAWERRVSEPMLPMRLLRIPAFAAANATGFLMMATITSAAFLMSQYFQLGLGHSPLSTGLHFLPWDGNKAELGTGRSIKEQMQAVYGQANVFCVKKMPVTEGIEAVRTIFPKCSLFIIFS